MGLSHRFTRGCMVGLAGGIANTLIGYLFFLLKFGTLRFVDFAVIFIYGREAKGLFEVLFAILIHWGFSAAAGVIFVYLLKAIKTKDLLLKGWIYGVSIWFMAYIYRTI